MVGSSSEDPRPCDVQATFCATLADEWIRRGVRHAVIAPARAPPRWRWRSPRRADIEIHIVHDERVAGFVAFGLGLSGAPALLLCTSGTAAANFFPAVVEAGLSEVPMIVLTADRPPELRGVGAPQTIDQIELYGAHVRWFHDADIATTEAAPTWRPLAQTAFGHSRTGPVQLNLGFREPLLGTPQAAPCAASATACTRSDDVGDVVPAALVASRGLVLVGGRSGVTEAQLDELRAATGWPLIADATSRLPAPRRGRHRGGIDPAACALRSAHDTRRRRAHRPPVDIEDVGPMG